MSGDGPLPENYLALDKLFRLGASIKDLDRIEWQPGEPARRIAYLCHSSGTLGPLKLAAISHRNVIANVMQFSTFGQQDRGGTAARKTVLGLLPASHIYGIVAISSGSTYRGDSVTKFDLQQMLSAVQKFKINVFSIVPPIVAALGESPELLDAFDLSSIEVVLCGGSPLDEGTVSRLQQHYPSWIFRNAYGLTEMAGVACMTPYHEPWHGSSGVVMPGVSLRLITEEGKKVASCEESGEVYAQSPGIIVGYWQDNAATKETFVQHRGSRWLRTGDIAVFRKSEEGHSHLFIVDRVKDLIKVKGSCSARAPA